MTPIWPILLLSASASAAQEPRFQVDGVFADHMVIQQGRAIPVRGQARPSQVMNVTFNGATASARADERGRWVARLPAQTGGTVGTLSVRDDSGAHVQFNDVAVGEVWLCSGQSNMDLIVAHAANPERTAREAARQPIRLMKVQRMAGVSVAPTLPIEIPWSRASEAVLPNFSAACWHMAVSLRAKGIDVPIGLIHAAWGGSTIEDWMSPEALRAAGVAEQSLETLRDYALNPEAAVARAVDQTDGWATSNDSGSAPAQSWFRDSPIDADWESVTLPGAWERSGIKALAAFDGVMWLRRSFELSATQAASGATLSLGRIDERDRVWINGEPVGATVGSQIERRYRIPVGLLRAGTNVIAVRVVDEMGSGGLLGPERAMRIEPEAGLPVPLAGTWRYRAGVSDDQWRTPPPYVPWSVPRGLSMAWHGMIAPLNDFPLAGIAWYQGESNASRAAAYTGLLEQWRADWRRQFGEARLPVVIVQLPGFGPRTSMPSNNNWAQLREVQRRVADADPKTGLAVTLDLGISNDIHPAHKDVVGQRMAGEAMRVAYGQAGPISPRPVSVTREPGGLRVRFRGAESGLNVYGAFAPTAFEWCTAARVCHFAEARVDGSTVLVTAPSSAAVVRYAWQGFPPVNLYGSNGLPVIPFEAGVR